MVATRSTGTVVERRFLAAIRAANLVDERAVRDFVQVRGRQAGVGGAALVTADDLHHAHHRRLDEIIALVGQPSWAEPGHRFDEILTQLRVIDRLDRTGH